jgi:hypothetical protein
MAHLLEVAFVLVAGMISMRLIVVQMVCDAYTMSSQRFLRSKVLG